MKIGILSMQKIPNYGSFLQAMSLKLQIEARGHTVCFIDVLPGRQIAAMPARASSRSLFLKLDKYAIKRIENLLIFHKMGKIYAAGQKDYLQTGKKLPQGESFDLAIIGSDEVFNATLPSPWGFSQQLFGKVDNAKRVVTYAASCGSATHASAVKYQITQELADAMANLEAISVRDKNTAEFVEEITGRTTILHVDPVFLSDFDVYIPKLRKRKPYLLVYAYANRINDAQEIAAIRQYAKDHHLDILCVGMQQRWCKHNITATAFELLAYVKNAACVVTDTFHGSVFSIKYNKKFVAFIRESNRNKLGDLLERFDLQTRSVEDPRKLEYVMEKSVDFARVNERIREECGKAYAYLDRILEGKELV